jgi:RimJ/RimL family protein N-acetyltransferase
MRNWGYHEDPLLEDYNFPEMKDKEIKKWYKYKTDSFFNRYYAVLNENNRLIGYLGIKSIKFIRRESTLGIVFDPNYVSKRYGTETLSTFLKYYFTEMKMKRMYLEVAEFNKRAHKLYQNMGFKTEGYYLDYFYDQKLNLNNPYYLEEESSFVISNKKIYNYIYKMKLEKEDFFETNRS